MMPEELEDEGPTILDLIHYAKMATKALEGFGFALPLIMQRKFIAGTVKNINGLLNQIQDKIDP